jgi:hypothetical protein
MYGLRLGLNKEGPKTEVIWDTIEFVMLFIPVITQMKGKKCVWKVEDR